MVKSWLKQRKSFTLTESISFRLLLTFAIESLKSADFSVFPSETTGEFSVAFWKSKRRVGGGLLVLLWLDEGVDVCETSDRDSTIELGLDLVAMPKLPDADLLLVERLCDDELGVADEDLTRLLSCFLSSSLSPIRK